MSRLEQLERLHAADAADADIIYMIAQERAKLGDLAAAVNWYDRCLAADPYYVYAFYHKARAQQSVGNRHAALTTARQGLALAAKLGQAKASSELNSLIDQLDA